MSLGGFVVSTTLTKIIKPDDMIHHIARGTIWRRPISKRFLRNNSIKMWQNIFMTFSFVLGYIVVQMPFGTMLTRS